MGVVQLEVDRDVLWLDEAMGRRIGFLAVGVVPFADGDVEVNGFGLDAGLDIFVEVGR